jgi:hypothetical protein
MITYRSAALAVAACAFALPLAACSAGVTSAGSTTASTTGTSTTGSTPTGSPSPHASSTAAGSLAAGSTISVAGYGSFPAPAGAQVLENIKDGKETVVFLGSVTPAKAATFYASALPRDGYTIIFNEMTNQKKTTEHGIQFTGHGYKGTIVAASNVNGTGGADLGSGNNLVEIVLSRH